MGCLAGACQFGARGARGPSARAWWRCVGPGARACAWRRFAQRQETSGSTTPRPGAAAAASASHENRKTIHSYTRSPYMSLLCAASAARSACPPRALKDATYTHLVPPSTGMPAWVTPPPNSSAVPRLGLKTQRGPGSPCLQNPVPPAVKALGGESASSTVSAWWSLCGTNSPPASYTLTAGSRIVK
jgi:hypothetical protein